MHACLHVRARVWGDAGVLGSGWAWVLACMQASKRVSAYTGKRVCVRACVHERSVTNLRLSNEEGAALEASTAAAQDRKVQYSTEHATKQ